jgi:hypothetical protein
LSIIPRAAYLATRFGPNSGDIVHGPASVAETGAKGPGQPAKNGEMIEHIFLFGKEETLGLCSL